MRKGELIHFAVKLQNYIDAENEERVKDYVLDAFDTWNPKMALIHPAHGMLKRAIGFLAKRGWRFAITKWKDIGVQAILVNGNNEWYHSSFDHSKAEPMNSFTASLFSNNGETIKPVIAND
jgi:hypothetical protein